MVQTWFEEGQLPTPVYNLADMTLADSVAGPALFMQDTCTIVVEPDCTATLTPEGNLKVTLGSGQPKVMSTELDMIHLSIFSHRFMSIAEQMGRALQVCLAMVLVVVVLDVEGRGAGGGGGGGGGVW